MVRDVRHDSAYLFGAICPDRGCGAAIIMPTVNTAAWHQTGGELMVPDNITLLPLPSYAPELNPMENVWEYLRANKLCSLVWDSYEEIVAACKAAWDFLIQDPVRIRSIGQRDWACVKV